jgi:hypothetical protein
VAFESGKNELRRDIYRTFKRAFSLSKFRSKSRPVPGEHCVQANLDDHHFLVLRFQNQLGQMQNRKDIQVGSFEAGASDVPEYLGCFLPDRWLGASPQQKSQDHSKDPRFRFVIA